ncbi:hypothetical protein ACFQ1L_26680 [Phytohabitans flavus]|uniref:hypothetical protein n=1 Tax=Phytohabitans flavus TaxID=1076124 RepID=UPI0036394FBD
MFDAPAPARAHPFGDPQTVAISLDQARPEVVRVRWKVGGLDDLTVLGVALGVLPRDRVMLDGAVFYQDSDAAAVGPSPRFAAYLRERITVTSDGRECAGTVAPPPTWPAPAPRPTSPARPRSGWSPSPCVRSPISTRRTRPSPPDRVVPGRCTHPTRTPMSGPWVTRCRRRAPVAAPPSRSPRWSLAWCS